METVELSAYGCTVMREGVFLAIDKVEERIRLYNDFGILSYRPCIVMFTDAMPTDDMEYAKCRLTEQEKRKS